MWENFAAVLALAGPVAGVPSALPAPTEPAPANVTVAWASPAHDAVVVAWDETGDVRNRVALVLPDGSATAVATLTVEAGRPNVSELPGFGGLVDHDFRVAVTVVDDNDEVLSEPGLSPAFDTNRPPLPVIETVSPRADGTVAFSWRSGELVDTTPGDPLDVPAEVPARFIPVASFSDFNDYQELVPQPITATSFVVPDRQKPYNVGVRTPPNEWSFSGVSAPVHGTRVTATIPKKVPAGGKLTVTGKAISLVRACDPGPCWSIERADAGRLLRLESRAGAGAAWQPVATTRARADGAFTFGLKFPGARDYRVVAPAVDRSGDEAARAYFATPAVAIKAAPPASGGDNGGDGNNGGNGGNNDGGGNGSGGSGGGGGAGLPITGAPVAGPAVAGGLLVAFGVAFALAGRRRGRRSAQAR
ncbi:hypothetical protein Ade02nite_06290 [Paractinoplanes deccanensis]|uniref:Uncharacterized protein n=1 Tax=Paractinoplanes deccanensis TaxID=113561 RepID=A0ABQ3XW60_9ACTN|nr:hypothetical protein [Actinoplanes deccanensis]GID71988.1 hypothetical protein Ade02nite_06290 [Actinoplanes deccanensis]